ncbi:hypothetical protein [Paenibacillus ottowii]|uniref:YgiT-type zinc finger protein n=1 Tax=Paenibacillus ottowii TaxID=2315729 RepID=A0ABY3B0Y7_9BACL|nr:hypothetical protein [Paenibacillus ottowii]TQR97346.1 hypothetical protein FKV70_19125 [Paenibacillus ottowii]
MTGLFDLVVCSDCGEKHFRSELRLITRYDGYDKAGEAVWVEDYQGCRICGSENMMDSKV